jgi:hypothetical protein
LVVVVADDIAVVGGCNCLDKEVEMVASGAPVEYASEAVPDYMVSECAVSAEMAGLAAQVAEVVAAALRSVAAWEMGPRLWVQQEER